jgi:lysozyme family protein
MASFEKAIPFVLAHEGGFVDDPADPGGRTKYGISQRRFPMEDIVNLTLDRAKQLYRQEWWDAYGYAGFEDQKVAEKVLDFSVNMGPQAAHRVLQRALRATGEGVKEDGIFGPKTMGAANRAIPGVLLSALRSEGAGYYRILLALDSKRERFINGWLVRAYA